MKPAGIIAQLVPKIFLACFLKSPAIFFVYTCPRKLFRLNRGIDKNPCSELLLGSGFKLFFGKKNPILKTTGWFNHQVVGRWLEVVFFLHAPDTLNREKWLPPLLKASVPQLQDEKVKEVCCELFGGDAMQRMYICKYIYIY